MTSVISFLENLVAHPAIAVGAFALVSSLLGALAGFLVILGKTVPGWIGTVITDIGTVTHLLNGSTPPAAPSVAAVPAAQTPAPSTPAV